MPDDACVLLPSHSNQPRIQSPSMIILVVFSFSLSPVVAAAAVAVVVGVVVVVVAAVVAVAPLTTWTRYSPVASSWTHRLYCTLRGGFPSNCCRIRAAS